MTQYHAISLQFYWVDNDAVPLGTEPTLAIDWLRGQPDMSGNCVQVRHVGGDDWRLDDRQCSQLGHIACQLPGLLISHIDVVDVKYFDILLIVCFHWFIHLFLHVPLLQR